MKKRNGNRLSCGEARSMMFEYLDGELGSRDSERLSAHISECPECRSELEDCKKLLDTIGKIEYPVPDRLHSNVMALVGAAAQDKPSRFGSIIMGGRRRGFAAVGTLAAACAVVALVILNRGYIEHGASDLAAPEIAQDMQATGATGEGDYYSTETVGALKFSSPMTTSEETAEPEYFAEAKAPVFSNDAIENYIVTGDDSYGYSADRGDINEDSDKLKIGTAEDAARLSEMIDSWVSAGTAVLVCNTGHLVVINEGEAIRVGGIDSYEFREITGDDAPVRLFELEKALENENVDFRSYLPDSADGFDCLVIAYSPEYPELTEDTAK